MRLMIAGMYLLGRLLTNVPVLATDEHDFHRTANLIGNISVVGEESVVAVKCGIRNKNWGIDLIGHFFRDVRMLPPSDQESARRMMLQAQASVNEGLPHGSEFCRIASGSDLDDADKVAAGRMHIWEGAE